MSRNARIITQIFQAHCPSSTGEKASCSFVSGLFGSCCPSTIHNPPLLNAFFAMTARVAGVIVNSVYGVLLSGRGVHILKEGTNIVPPPAQSYTSTAVMMISCIILIEAPLLNIRPCAVNLSPSANSIKAVNDLSLRKLLSLKTPATCAITSNEITAWNFGRSAALTDTFPIRFTSMGVKPSDSPNYRESSELLPDQINLYLAKADHFISFAATRFYLTLPDGESTSAFDSPAVALVFPNYVSMCVPAYLSKDREKSESLSGDVLDERAKRDFVALVHAHTGSMGSSSDPRSAQTDGGCAFNITSHPLNTRRIS